VTATHHAAEPDDKPASRPGLLASLAANATILTALMFYMGWAYLNSWLGYFNISALGVGFGAFDFLLRSMSLFSPYLVIAGAAVAVALGTRSWGLVPASIHRHLLRSAALARPAGLALTAAGVVLALLARHIPTIPTYLVILLIGSGLLLSLPPRPTAGNPRATTDRAARIAATLIIGSCAFWAASLLASGKGTDDAVATASNLPNRIAVAVYSTYRLALAGPGVNVETFPANEHYRYRYTGLRLLLTRPDRYFVVPVGWRHGLNATYVINVGGDTRVELLPGARS
jgi:hypothetical protein